MLQASPALLKEMEACARALASSVGYVGAATVEFLYGLASQQYYFLELNPRLQVKPPPCSYAKLPVQFRTTSDSNECVPSLQS